MPLSPQVERALVLAAMTRARREADDLLGLLDEPARARRAAHEIASLPRDRCARRLARLATDLFGTPSEAAADETDATPGPWRLWLRRRVLAERGG